VALADLGVENVEAVEHGFANLQRHIENVRKFGVPPVVSINRFASDTQGESDALFAACGRLGVEVAITEIHAHGGEGGRDLAEKVLAAIDSGKADFRPLYPLGQPLKAKIETIAKEVYRASGVSYTATAQKDIKRLE